jgi:cephalosporin hydroxylase
MSRHDPKDPAQIAAMAADTDTRRLSRALFDRSCEFRYSYNFSWMGRPIIQYPQDIIALQEIIWSVKPQLIVETGVAHGGSLVFLASMLELIGGEGRVVGVDIEIRPHNRQAIEEHRMASRITLVEGSSTDAAVVSEVHALAEGRRPIMVILDSNHSHAHVLKELQAYAPLVTNGSYLVVFDTVVEDMPADAFPNRPWGRGNSPKTAVREFLASTTRFAIDHEIDGKLLLTVAPDGYLKCVGD